MEEKIGILIDSGGMCWIQGRSETWETDPAWIGPFRRIKAKRFARKHNIQLYKDVTFYKARRKPYW